MKTVKYIKGTKLDWADLWSHFSMTQDNGGRWYPSESTQEYVNEHLSGVRAPSRAWPMSYAKAMLTQKFAKLVVEKEPDLAVKLGIGEVASDG